MIAGVTGRLSAPETLLLGRYDPQERLRYVGRTRPPTPLQRKEVAEQLPPITTPRRGSAAHPWPRPLPAGWLGQFGSPAALDYVQVEPDQVAEVEVDTAYEPQAWRHPPVFVRIRAEMHPMQVPLVGTDEWVDAADEGWTPD